MWMVDPRMMCRQHLLGEHRELHALVGIVARGTSLAGYVAKGLIETRLIQPRHEALVSEMLDRGYNHYSPLSYVDVVDQGRVDEFDALTELVRRCEDCLGGLMAISTPLGRAANG